MKCRECKQEYRHKMDCGRRRGGSYIYVTASDDSWPYSSAGYDYGTSTSSYDSGSSSCDSGSSYSGGCE